jgi:3-methylcrotonyl-CoA carboxylase alpha subunit
MKVQFQFAGQPIECDLSRDGWNYKVETPLGVLQAVMKTDGNLLSIAVDERPLKVPFAREKEKLFIHLNGKVWEFTFVEPGFASGSGSEKFDGKLYPPMPGNIVKVMVTEGDAVQKGQPLLILESMKMEHTVASPAAGKVIKVNASPGAVAELTKPLIEIVIAAGKPEG